MPVTSTSFSTCAAPPSTVTRRAVGSLLLGYRAGGAWTPAGRTGTGFSARVAADLSNLQDRLPPFSAAEASHATSKWRAYFERGPCSSTSFHHALSFVPTPAWLGPRMEVVDMAKIVLRPPGARPACGGSRGRPWCWWR